ncbi:MAG: hypothetical protein ACK559_39510, partial [bacterium]
ARGRGGLGRDPPVRRSRVEVLLPLRRCGSEVVARDQAALQGAGGHEAVVGHGAGRREVRRVGLPGLVRQAGLLDEGAIGLQVVDVEELVARVRGRGEDVDHGVRTDVAG